MATIALIGADGSGKTTIADMLLKSPPVKMKYLYMGLNIESSNYALPTSRLIYYMKLMKYKKKNKDLKDVKLKNMSLHELDDNRSVDKRNKLGAIARLLNRLAESWYRQLISWMFQLRGYVVLYDRHYIFDSSTNQTNDELKQQRFTTKVHRWMINNAYSKPDLVIFLYAPAEVLYERKGEADLEYLEGRTQSFMKVGKKFKNFVIVDATQEVEKVFEDTKNEIVSYLNNHKN
jgi:thymidylate kinase